MAVCTSCSDAEEEKVQVLDALAVESVPTHEVRPVLTMSEPVFTQKLQDLVVGNGEEVRFDARIIAVPEPHVEWFKGSTKIADEGRFVHIDALEKDQFTLIIEQAEAGDSGRYKCVASNEMGTSSCTAELTVTEKEVKPETTDKLERAAIGVLKGDGFTSNVGVKGTPHHLSIAVRFCFLILCSMYLPYSPQCLVPQESTSFHPLTQKCE